MKVGMTGTRYGMTKEQTKAFVSLIKELKPTEFHHGSCKGADVEGHSIVQQLLHAGQCKIIVHPGPESDPWQGIAMSPSDIRESKNHFARNRDIVNETECLIVCPLDTEHRNRGGTWYTHDYAEEKGKLIYIVWPDGNVERLENS